MPYKWFLQCAHRSINASWPPAQLMVPTYPGCPETRLLGVYMCASIIATMTKISSPANFSWEYCDYPISFTRAHHHPCKSVALKTALWCSVLTMLKEICRMLHASKAKLADGINTVVNDANAESTPRTVHRSNCCPLVCRNVISLHRRQLAAAVISTDCIYELIETTHTCQHQSPYSKLQINRTLQ